MRLSTIQSRWVSALRSGLFAQTKVLYPYLREDDGFTALGVLCELARIAGVVEGFNPAQDVPPKVTEWVGLKFPYASSLSLADNSKTFAEMASAIILHAEELFEVTR